MTAVAVADDQALVRSGFAVLLRSADDIEVVGEAADGAEAVALVKAEQPDVVLMDIRMPEMDGLEATRQITANDATAATRVLILTTFDHDEYVYEALRAGASGFLLKDTLPEDLLSAVRVVAAGEALLAPKITRRLIERFAEQGSAAAPVPNPGLDSLTEREARSAECRRAWPVERRDRRATLHVARDREDARQPAAHETRCTGSRAAGSHRVRSRCRRPGSAVVDEHSHAGVS